MLVFQPKVTTERSLYIYQASIWTYTTSRHVIEPAEKQREFAHKSDPCIIVDLDYHLLKSYNSFPLLRVVEVAVVVAGVVVVSLKQGNIDVDDEASTSRHNQLLSDEI